MKPILFAANATTFTSNGLGALDPTSCVVTEERNGQYELECVVPVDSDHFSDLHNNMILVVIPGDGMSVHPTSQRQAFRIYHITEPLNGLVTINARHISYDLSYNTVMQFTATTISTAFSGIVSNMVEANLFTFDTDKTTSANFKVSVPQTARQLLGGQQGSILDVYGGEYQWDNWKVNLWGQRGTDSDVTLRYGKNITDISQEQNLENVVTGIVPFWSNEDSVVTLPEKSVDSQYASQYPYKRTIPVDFSSEWENAPTESQLRSRAQSYITANKIGVPKVSIKVSFVALWQTEEYKSVAPLERVHLCDTVGVVFEKYGINTRAEVIKTEWDCLAERYLSIELGEAHSSFARTIVSMNDETTTQISETKTVLQNAIDAATAAINGADGGYLVIEADASGHPTRMFIMDQPSTADATVVWQYNKNGWGVSTNGINGPYLLAATLDPTYGAAINASYIRVGKMSCDYIEGGIFQSKDTGHKFYVNMDTGDATLDGITLKNVSIAGMQGVDVNLGTLGLAFYRKNTTALIGYVAASIVQGAKHFSILGDTDATLDIGAGAVDLSSVNDMTIESSAGDLSIGSSSGDVGILANGDMTLLSETGSATISAKDSIALSATNQSAQGSIDISVDKQIELTTTNNGGDEIDLYSSLLKLDVGETQIYGSPDGGPPTFYTGTSGQLSFTTGGGDTVTINIVKGLVTYVSVT